MSSPQDPSARRNEKRKRTIKLAKWREKQAQNQQAAASGAQDTKK